MGDALEGDAGAHERGLVQARPAVVGGQGAGLLPDPLVAADLAEGRLVALAAPVEVDAFAYYLVVPELAAERPKIAAFRAWALAAR